MQINNLKGCKKNGIIYKKHQEIFMIRYLKLSESEKSNCATSIALKQDAKKIKLQTNKKYSN